MLPVIQNSLQYIVICWHSHTTHQWGCLWVASQIFNNDHYYVHAEQQQHLHNRQRDYITSTHANKPYPRSSSLMVCLLLLWYIQYFFFLCWTCQKLPTLISHFYMSVFAFYNWNPQPLWWSLMFNCCTVSENNNEYSYVDGRLLILMFSLLFPHYFLCFISTAQNPWKPKNNVSHFTKGKSFCLAC